VGDSYLAVTGYATFKAILHDYFEHAGDDAPYSTRRPTSSARGIDCTAR
jgi:hypothetical protein